MPHTLSKLRLRAVLLSGCLGVVMLAFPNAVWAQSDSVTNLDEVQAEFAEAFEAIGDYSAAQRDEAVAELEATLTRVDDRIEALEGRVRNEWSQMSEATREQTAAALRNLRDRRNQLSEALGALSQGAGAAWDDLVQGIRNGWNDLEAAWDEAAAAGTEPEKGD